jgi:hypothetical protein
VNGTESGLVEVVIDPPLYIGRRLSTGFMKRRVNSLIMSLADPGGFTAAWTWRDIRQQPARQIRGSKRLWRILSAANTLGSVSYWLVGRRYG